MFLFQLDDSTELYVIAEIFCDSKAKVYCNRFFLMKCTSCGFLKTGKMRKIIRSGIIPHWFFWIYRFFKTCTILCTYANNQARNKIYSYVIYKCKYSLGVRSYFSTNPTFENPLENPTSYLVEAGFFKWVFEKWVSQ